jgi:Rad3-related DNA helicase
MAANFPHEMDSSRGGAIITSQKTLQDQYTKDFSGIACDLRSSANYPCQWADGVVCAEALRIQRASGGWPCSAEPSCLRGMNCPYKNARKMYTESEVGITNYSYLLSEATYVGALKKRQLLILDEAHRVENELRRWASVQVDEEICESLGLVLPESTKSDQEIHDWMAYTYYPTIRTMVATLAKKFLDHKGKRKKIPNQLRAMARQYEFLDKKMCQLTRYITDKSQYKSEYVTVHAEGPGGRQFEVKPLDVVHGAHDILFSRGEKILLMSATILDFESFSRSLGLPKDKTHFISIPSPFDPKKFGIIYRPIAKMNRSAIVESLPMLVNQIKNILAENPDSKGIIHTNSYEITRAVGTIKNSRLIVQAAGVDREKMIEDHVKSPEPTVLVSPAMMEGLDLHDDLGRFQVICKVPYPFLGDPIVKRLLDRSQRWYNWQTALVLVQSVGRCVRNEDDWAKTYILDECFGTFFVKNSSFFTNAFSAMEIDDTHVVKESLPKKWFPRKKV